MKGYGRMESTKDLRIYVPWMAHRVRRTSKRLWGKLRRRAAELRTRKATSQPEESAPRDTEAYQRICELVPELASYKKETIQLLQDHARNRGLASLAEYHELLLRDKGALADLRTSLTLKGTHFFRGDDWGTLTSECLSTFAGRSQVRAWCAGCSAGMEAFSTVLALSDYVPLEGISLLATDYDHELLAQCRDGVYSSSMLHEIPQRYREHALKLAWSPYHFTFEPAIRACLTVRHLNLLTDPYPAPFDLIVCRNVLKFFAPEVIERCQEQLVASLAPGGFLFTSTDDRTDDREMIREPERLGLRQIAGKSIYQRIG